MKEGSGFEIEGQSTTTTPHYCPILFLERAYEDAILLYL
jgi:hypothetical protein